MSRADTSLQRDPMTYTRRRLVVAAAAVLLPAVAFSQFRGRGAKSVSPLLGAPAIAPTDTLTATTVPSTASSSSVVASSLPLIQLEHDLGLGANGASVVALQDRLRQIGFDPGPSDGSFGPSTERSLWAYEKFILHVAPDSVSGVITPDEWTAMNNPLTILPRRAGSGTHLEVLLPEQVAVLYVDDQVRLITHVSSGTGEEWCAVVAVDNDDGTQTEQGVCGVAVTPGGMFHFERRVVGWRNSKLGRLYNPVYFNYGIAVHGASNVPRRPASHGCVRIPMHIAEYFPSLVADGDLVYVFDGVKEPETYGAQVPIFDYPDPNFTTTTTTTTTTFTSTTTAPTTTSQPPTTAPTTTHVHVEQPITTSAVATTTSATVPSGDPPASVTA